MIVLVQCVHYCTYRLLVGGMILIRNLPHTVSVVIGYDRVWLFEGAIYNRSIWECRTILESFPAMNNIHGKSADNNITPDYRFLLKIYYLEPSEIREGAKENLKPSIIKMNPASTLLDMSNLLKKNKWSQFSHTLKWFEECFCVIWPFNARLKGYFVQFADY